MPRKNSWAFQQWWQDSWDPQWDHHNSWWDHNHQNSQCYPVPRWDQYQAGQPSRYSDCGFDNNYFPYQGSGSYRRRSHGRFYGKCSSSFYKGKNISSNSSCILVTKQQSKKENDSEVKKDKSVISKESKQAQEDPVASAKISDPPQINLGTGSKTEDGHKGAHCTQAAPSELPAALENLELKKEEEEIELRKMKCSQAAEEAQPSPAASLPFAKAPMEGQAPFTTAGSFHPVAKEDPMPAPEVHHSLVASFSSAEAPTGKQAPPETMKDSSPVIKEEPVTESIHPMVKEEPVLLESSQPTDCLNNADSPPAAEIPFLSETTDKCQSDGKEDLELTEMGGSHEDRDYLQSRDALTGVSSALPVIPSVVHSVPMLVRGKETELPHFWESESSLHAKSFNWSVCGRGWAPEDYQEPSWGLDEAKKCDDVSEPDRHLVLSHSSFHSPHSCDQNSDAGRVSELCSSSPESRHSTDSKHSSTQRTTKRLRSPLRQGHHLRSPLRQRWRSRSPMRRREIISKDCCNKCHCKCCQKPSRERFQERAPLCSYSTHKMHRYPPSKECSKSYRTSHCHSPENSMVKSQKRERKSTYREETKKGRSASVKQMKSSKVNKKARKIRTPANHDAALAVETSIPSETTEPFKPVNAEENESVHLTATSDHTDSPHKPCPGKETSTSAPSKIAEDPRSVAVLTRRNQIEQDYLQVVLNFAVVATMLLEKEPCMEQALEVALRANMRSVGDYYESMLKNFIDDYDLSETC